MHSYNYTMEMGFVDQIRLTQQKIFGKLVDCLKLNWNFIRTTYISSMDYTQTIPTVSHTAKFHLYFSTIFNTSANNLCCCCYLGSVVSTRQLNSTRGLHVHLSPTRADGSCFDTLECSI